MKPVARKFDRQNGYILLSVMLLITLMLIALSVELPRIAQQIKRQKEEELVHRGTEYATAIKKFFHKTGRYPTSLEQLENTNRIRFLRKKYKDPITGESDWKLVRAGEAEVKIPPPKNVAGLPGGLNPSANVPGTSTGGGGGATTAVGGQSGVAGGTGQAAPGNTGSLTTQNVGNGQQLGGAGIIGVASVSKATSIKEFNEKDHYNEWFFVYDPRLEQAGGTGVTVASPRGGVAAGDNGGQNPAQQNPSAQPQGQNPAGAPLPPDQQGPQPTPTPQVPR